MWLKRYRFPLFLFPSLLFFFLLCSQQPGLLEFIQPLLNVEQLASKCRQWRLHSTLLEEFSCLTVCMTSDQLYNKFVPVCWKYVGKSVRFCFCSFSLCVCMCSYLVTCFVKCVPEFSVCCSVANPTLFIHGNIKILFSY